MRELALTCQDRTMLCHRPMRASQCSAICLEHHLLHNCFKTKYCLLGGEEMQSFANLSGRLFSKSHQTNTTVKLADSQYDHINQGCKWISKYQR